MNGRRRDASIHIPVSDERVAEIHAIASQVVLPWSAEIDNRGPLDVDRIVGVVRRLVERPDDVPPIVKGRA